jgi:hypothetical protein
MPDIVLTTLNAKFIHAAFGLRYLFANLGELQPRAVIAEFDINLRPLDIAEALLAREPKILGFGVYIWNVTETTEVSRPRASHRVCGSLARLSVHLRILFVVAGHTRAPSAAG